MDQGHGEFLTPLTLPSSSLRVALVLVLRYSHSTGPGASIHWLNVGTWAGGERVVQPTLLPRESRLRLLRRGHLLMSRSNLKGW